MQQELLLKITTGLSATNSTTEPIVMKAQKGFGFLKYDD
jgi:exoribonuclease II